VLSEVLAGLQLYFDKSLAQNLLYRFEREQYVSGRKCGKPLGPDAPHYPNKAERRELAKIMQESGLTEEEVRKNKDHRRRLAQAAKSPTQQGSTDRRQLRLKRHARVLAKNKGIPIWEAQKLAGLELQQRRSYWW
jgi:hypothetical protein